VERQTFHLPGWPLYQKLPTLSPDNEPSISVGDPATLYEYY